MFCLFVSHSFKRGFQGFKAMLNTDIFTKVLQVNTLRLKNENIYDL